jgi:methylenetetrahydrofolate dehydrogenase (NADP+) / methenyltetrahydrofolate cyclohydrolase
MSALVIRGKETAEAIRGEIRQEVEALASASEGRVPGLAVVLVGDDPGSAIYVRNKKKATVECGMKSFGYELPADVPEAELLGLIDALNADPNVHGILCQLPLPKHLDEFEVTCRIDPAKDVDGLHPMNVGLLSMGREGPVSCTPAGVMVMLHRAGIEVAGKECVVIGRSNIVGKPIAQLLLKENGTVTVCHSRTKDLKAVVKRADVVVVAIGRPRFVTGDWIKPGAVVVDVGINRNAEGKVVGDVDFDSVAEVAGAVTPVPNGVGPMTIAMLLRNTLDAFKRAEKARAGAR